MARNRRRWLAMTMAQVPTVCVIVLNWNGRDDTLACLASLSKVVYPRLRLLVVDNGSVDGSTEAIRDAFPNVAVLETGKNLGYSGGNNAGFVHALKQSDDDFFLVLNNDTVVAPDFVSQLVNAARLRPEGGLFGPMIYRADSPDTISFAGGFWDAANSICMHHGEGERDVGQFGEMRETDYLTGCALLIRREVLMATRGFDDRFFLYYEDTELCYRSRRLGYACIFVPNARIFHSVSASLGGASTMSSYFLARNRLLFAELHLPRLQYLRLLINVVVETLLPATATHPQVSVPLWKRLYWIFRTEGIWSRALYRDPFYRARLHGTRDYVRRRFGNVSPELKTTFDRWRREQASHDGQRPATR